MLKEQEINYRVKFINNKSYWYHGDCEIGDLVYCNGSQEGILGKVVETSQRVFAMCSIISVVGHIQLENKDDIIDLWNDLNKEERNKILEALSAKEPYTKDKFINSVSNFWTVKGSEGMEWKDFLPFVLSYAQTWKPEIPESYDSEFECFNGFKWERIEIIPEAEELKYDFLINGVLYGTAEMIADIRDRYELKEVTEFLNGIYRATFNEIDIMREYPSCKAAFFSINGYSATAVYSESGYPYLTKAVHTPVKLNHGEDYSFISHYYPDEIFRDSTSGFETGKFDVSFNAPFDKEFRSLDYVMKRDDILYQMKGIDYMSPPETKDADWSYQTDENEVILNRYKGKKKEVIFPEELEGKKVIGIASRFGKEDDSYTKLQSITIPEGYRYIGAYAFCGCRKLINVNLPSSLEMIGDGAFLKCANLKEITIPKSVRYIRHNYDDSYGGRYMFHGCSKLERAYIYKGLDYKKGVPFEGRTKVCLKNYEKKDKQVKRLLIDTRMKDLEAWPTLEVYVGQILTIHLDMEAHHIELYTPYHEYAGLIVENDDCNDLTEHFLSTFLDHSRFLIISEKMQCYDDIISEAEAVFC